MGIVVTIDERGSSQAEREALYGNGLIGQALDELAFAVQPDVTLRVIHPESGLEDDVEREEHLGC